MKNIFKITKKELDKIFKFPRTIFTTLILPGLVLFIVYAFIGIGIDKSMDVESKSIIHVINSPTSFEDLYNQPSDQYELIKSESTKLDELKKSVLEGTVGAIIYYVEDFDDLVGTVNEHNVIIFFDQSTPESSIIYNQASSVVEIHKQIVYSAKGMVIFETIPGGLAADEQASAAILAMILPLLLMTFIFASALGLGSDAVAGEKERGTLATLLMLPIKRSEVIIGKIVSTSALTILSAISSFLGLLASLPFSKSMFGMSGPINYSALEFVGLFVIVIIIALLASAILLIISTIAKTVKEATTMAMPVYILALVMPIFSMNAQGGEASKSQYLIPVYNTVLGLKEIISRNFDLTNFIIIATTSFLYVFLFVLVLIRLFKSERVLYSK